MFDINKLKSGDVFEYYQQDLFNTKEYLYRGKGIFKLICDNDKALIFEDEHGEIYGMQISEINTGFWKLYLAEE